MRGRSARAECKEAPAAGQVDHREGDGRRGRAAGAQLTIIRVLKLEEAKGTLSLDTLLIPTEATSSVTGAAVLAVSRSLSILK